MNARSTPLTILVVGATGSIGTHVVVQAVTQGHRVKALVRSEAAGSRLHSGAEPVKGDLTNSETLGKAVDGIDAVVFTHGSTGGTRAEAERVDYGAVLNVITSLHGRTDVRVALMTSIGVTNRTGAYNRSTEIHDWKRRGERLLRASGLPCTVVRPGWFDYNATDQHTLHFLQGDTRQAGDPSDGVVSRRQIAQVLLSSLFCDDARGKTLELVAEHGPAQDDLSRLFAALVPDSPSDATGFDAVRDTANMPLHEEPERVRHALSRIAAARATAMPGMTSPFATKGIRS